MLTTIPNQNASRLNSPWLVGLVLVSFLTGLRIGVPEFSRAGEPPVVRSQSSDLSDEDSTDDKPRTKVAKPRSKITKTAAIDDDSEAMPASEDVQPTVALPERVIGNGFGTMGRASHLIGKTFGRNDSITPLEYMPYMLTDANFFFADLRGFVTNNSQGGGNLGIGFRRLFDDQNAWAGASLWYDGDQSTSRMYQQIGLSFEALIQQWEIRSNVYLPVTSTQNFGNTITNPQIVGNQLLYTRTIDIGTALRGVDVEVGYSRPVLDKHIVRGFVGGYFFQGGSINNVTGIKARVEGVINNTVTAQVLYTNDNLYGSNFMVGLSMQFPFGKDHPNTGWIRNTPSPFRFVERNYNVIVDRNVATYANQVATNPNTGNPYIVDQVNSSASGGTPDGTTGNPYSTVAAAQSAGGNIILVQNGSVLNQPITLTAGQNLFGQGNYNAGVATTGGGIVPMPALAQSVTQVTPIIQNVSGTAITLASNTQVAGFNIINPSGDGIAGSGVSNVSLHDLVFSSIGADAINLTNSTGSLTLGNLQVSSATGNGIVINGGNPDVVFNGGGQTISAAGNGFVLQNLTGGAVSLSNLSLTNTGGSGLVIDTVATNVSVNSLSVSQSGSTGSAVSITGNTGTSQVVNGVTKYYYNTYSFSGNTTITSPNGTGFSASNTDAIINVTNLSATSTASSPAVSLSNATSPITFAGLSANTQNATGLYASNVTSLQVNTGSFTTVNAPAMDIESSGFNANLSYVSVNGGAYGIKVDNSTGNLSIQGSGSAGSGGTIQNTTTAGIIINSFGNTALNWLTFTNNAAGIQSTGSSSLSLNSLTMTGQTGYAIDSMNDKSFTLVNSTLTSNGTAGGTGSVRIQANVLGTYATYIGKDVITDSNGTGIQLLTQAAAAGSPLTFTLTNDSLTGYNNGSNIVTVNWSGQTNSTVSNNTIYAYGSGMTALLLQDPSTNTTLTEAISSNTIVFQKPTGMTGATNGTGIWIINGQSGVTNTGNSVLTIASNTVQFEATGGTGIRFGLYDSTSDLFTRNAITDYAGGATGMLFDYVGSGSAMELLGNNVTLLSGDPLTHRGIIFSQVAPTLDLLSPSGSASNWVYNTTTFQNGFSIPSGTATGGIIIDGTYIPAP